MSTNNLAFHGTADSWYIEESAEKDQRLSRGGCDPHNITPSSPVLSLSLQQNHRGQRVSYAVHGFEQPVAWRGAAVLDERFFQTVDL